MELNHAQYVLEMTAIALNATSERTRIETLTLLDGVSWPTASVILHFFHRRRYPILDFRALWSVGLEPPVQYGFNFFVDLRGILSRFGATSFLRLSPDRIPSLGDDVFTIGYPTPDLLGTDPKYTNGTVSALSGLRGDASFLQISVPIQPGNSGGPLVNEDGDVIGVVMATASTPAFIRATDSIPQNINWAVKSAFATVLFTPPSADVAPATGRDDIIDRVTEATCLVRVTSPAQ